MIYIHHHLGLGDHIICNGLVRELVKNDSSCLYAKHTNANTVRLMYRDLLNLSIIGVNNDEEITNPMALRIGFDYILKAREKNLTWDQAFYHQCGIDFNKRWDSFFIKRDYEREQDLYKKLNPLDLPFSLVHSKGSDGIERVKEEYVSKKILKIKKANFFLLNLMIKNTIYLDYGR